MKQSDPLISIIVPVYNVEEYLSLCVNSVVNQTYKNLEIILVNDGSTDNSGEICNYYTKKDNRIIVINKENGGLSDARNAALDVMSGKYVFCLDSDDYIAPKTIEVLYKNMKKFNADIATTNYIEFFDAANVKNNNVIEPKVLDTETALEALMYQKGCKTSAWGKLYKAELFDEIRYPKGKICEDLPTTYKLFARAKKVCIGVGNCYYYRQRPDSIINSDFTIERMDALSFAEDETEFISNEFPEIEQSAVCREFLEAIYILTKLYKHDGEYKNAYLRVKKSIIKNRSTVLFDKNAPKKYRLCAGMSYVNIKLLQTLMGKKYMRGSIRSDCFFRTKYHIKMLLNSLKKLLGNEKLNIDYDNSVVFLLACDYNNIGDVLIRVSQESFLKQNIKDKKVVAIGFNDTYHFLKDIEKNATKNTIVVLTGGGDVDDRYTEIERTRNYIIKLLEKNGCRIISFPQTIDYSNTKKGAYYLKKAKISYGSNKNFVFIAREKKSYNFAKKNFDGVKIYFTPDIVFSHDTIIKDKKREGIGLLFRNDGEKIRNDKFIKSLLDCLGNKYKVSKNDMSVDNFEKDKIYDYMNDKINFVSEKQLIITDRLHGMILCYITNTPCIVFPNVNHKITETYNNWLAGKQNFIKLEKDNNVDRVIGDVDILIGILRHIKKESMDDDFGVLIKLLNEGVG